MNDKYICISEDDSDHCSGICSTCMWGVYDNSKKQAERESYEMYVENDLFGPRYDDTDYCSECETRLDEWCGVCGLCPDCCKCDF